MNSLKLYTGFMKAYLKTKLEYRFAFFMDFGVHIFSNYLTYLGMWIIFRKFQMVKGWNFYEVIFLYSLNLLTYGICGLFFFTPVRRLEGMVRDGTFDGLLLKPLSPFWHLIFRYFNHDFLGHIIIAGLVTAMCFQRLTPVWTWGKVLWLSAFLIGGTLIQAGLMIMAATVCFWFFTSNMVIDAAIYSVRGFINYPIVIYEKWLQVLLTFVLPYAFVNYYPAEYFLGKAPLFHPLIQYGTPVVGVGIFGLAMVMWNAGINRYQSAGA